jgi:hypothetical protein
MLQTCLHAPPHEVHMAHSYSRAHLSDQTLLRNLAARVAEECSSTAEMLADLAEVDGRRLYAPAGYPSMYSYCVEELHLSEQSALKRIRAARATRQFPAILDAVAQGRLHLTALVLLAPYLRPETVDELLAAATHKSAAAIEQLLAQRFPRPDIPTRVQALAPPVLPADTSSQLSSRTVGTPNPESRESPGPPAKVVPLSPQRFYVQLTMDQETHDMMQYAQSLLGHQVRPGDVASVFHRALQALISQLEKTKFAATDQPRKNSRDLRFGRRHIPAAVKRAVGAGFRPLHLHQRCGTALSCPQHARVRSCGPRGARRTGNGGQDPSPVSGPQPIRSGVRLRHRVHEEEAKRGPITSRGQDPGSREYECSRASHGT